MFSASAKAVWFPLP